MNLFKYNFYFSVKKLFIIYAVYQHRDQFAAEFTKSTSGIQQPLHKIKAGRIHIIKIDNISFESVKI
jgi:hypothetical protein